MSVILERVSSGIIQRRLLITSKARLMVSTSELVDGVLVDKEIDLTDDYKVMLDMGNAAWFWMRLQTGEVPEIFDVTPIGLGRLPPPLPALIGENGRKNKAKKTMGLFAMAEGDMGERLGRLEITSKEPYVINSLVDFNNGPFNQQEPDYESMVPLAQIDDHRDLSDWNGAPVKEIIWGIYDWVERPVQLPNEKFNKVIDVEPDDVATKKALKEQRRAEQEEKDEKVRRLGESLGM